VKDYTFLLNGFEIENDPEIILVEDDPSLGKVLADYLEKKTQIRVRLYNNPQECIEGLESTPPSLFCLVTDISFEESAIDGLYLIDILKEKKYKFISIVMTGFASIEGAIKATKKGVYHYLTKPFEMKSLLELLGNSLEKEFSIPKTKILREQLNRIPLHSKRNLKVEGPEADDIFQGIVGRSRVMKKVFERIKKVAESDSTVFISGPSGTGKELVAKAIHNLSPRINNELVCVNCGAIPQELLESELFGHVKGAFTGAISDKMGRFEIADKGSIFLDEIGDMPLLLQVKILRVLQNREIEKVGGHKNKVIDVRIITATHKDLEKEVKEGNFREDLFYRLNVIPIVIPPLSQRREDIPLLINYFLKRFSSADGRNSLSFDDDALELMVNYNWPGNVRELENLIERLVILKGGQIIKARDLPSKFYTENSLLKPSNIVDLPSEGLNLRNMIAQIEYSLIQQAVERTKGNKNQASKLLGLNRTTLIEKMKKFSQLSL
jgi:two-component system response regulator PilR (NtrC family)